MGDKKIGLVCVTNNNYGSLLQTYALQLFLQKYNFRAEILNYKEPATRKLCRMRNLEYAKSKLKSLYYKVYIYFFRKKIHTGLKERNLRCEEFKRKQLKCSALYKSFKNLEKQSYNYNVIILGSDQVWHPLNLSMNYFTLSFVPQVIRKIAYAPSFGVSSLPESKLKRYRDYISRFDFLSVRETSGQEIIKNLLKKEPMLVCDPTLLLDTMDWVNIVGEKRTYGCDYIFCYFIGDNPSHRIFANKVAEKYNYKIVTLKHIDEFIKPDEAFGDFSPYNIGPLDFLNLILNSSIVLTDSFHATVFSIQFRKPFYTFYRFSNADKKSTNSRLFNFLCLLHLENFLLNNEDCLLDNNINIKCPDYEEVHFKIKEIRMKSQCFLLNALKNG